jgi:hypothetical protein
MEAAVPVVGILETATRKSRLFCEIQPGRFS